MKTTALKLKKPDSTDPVNIQDLNDNMDILDAELQKRPLKTGSSGDMTTEFSQASSRVNLTSGETLKTSMGKITKWFSDLKAAAFQAVANNLTTTAAGSVLDARQGKVLGDKISEVNSNLFEAESIIVVDSGHTIASIISGVPIGKIRTFRLQDIPADYPPEMMASKNTSNPVITIEKASNIISYIYVFSPNMLNGIPHVVYGYFNNGNVYWGTVQ